MRVRTWTLVAMLLGSGLTVLGCVEAIKPTPSRLPPGLRDVLWQLLPEEVQAVYVGPDQRLWTITSNSTGAVDPAGIRQMIEREFYSPSPRLVGVRPALFEENGRVWFIADGGTLLLAYDGRPGHWIEHRTPQERPFVGNCPGHGRLYRAGYNLQLGNRLFFIDGQGVHLYSCGEWDYQQLTETKYRHTGMESCFDLVPLGPDRGVVALLTRQREDPWWWHDGRWQQVPLPLDSPHWSDPWGAFQMLAGAPLGADLLLHFANNQEGFLRLLPLDAGKPRDFDRLAALLAHASFRVRQDASSALVALGMGAARAAEELLKQPDLDPETRSRLQQVVRKINERYDKPFRVDGCTPQGVAALWAAPTGDIFIAADHWLSVMDGADAGPRLAVIHPDGTVKTFSGSQYVKCWDLLFQQYAYPYLGPDRRRLYLPGEYVLSPRMLDLETGEITFAPDGNFYWLQAVMADGTSFLSRGEPRASQGPGVAVWHPGRPDDRHVLRGECVPLQEGIYGVASDGTVWAHPQQQGLAQFDGHRWQTRAAVDSDECLAHLLPGAGGTVLAVIEADQRPERTVFWTGRESIEGGPLLEFIQQHADLIRSAFRPLMPAFSRGTDLIITVDKAGHIWVCDKRVQVLAGNQWLEAPLPPRHDNPNYIERICFMAAVGDGRRVYLSSLELAANRGVACLAEVRDGQVVLTEAPDCGQDLAHTKPVLMPDGTLWLNRVHIQARDNWIKYIQRYDGMLDSDSGVLFDAPSSIHEGCHAFSAAAEPPLDEPSHTRAVPIVTGKPLCPVTADVVHDVGWAKILDPGGFLWTDPGFWSKEKGHLFVVRPGASGTASQVLGRIKVPYADAYGMMCASDQPGSIYVWGLGGLHHFSAVSTDRPGDYRLDITYTLEGDGRPLCAFNSSSRDFGYTPLGFFVVLRWGDDRYGKSIGSQLFLIPVPGDSKSTRPGQR